MPSSLQAVILDWAGTTVDHGCFAPVGVFQLVFERRGVPITIAQAREPMGLEKRDHIRTIAAMPAVSAAWQAAHGRALNEDDVAAMYGDTIDLQIDATRQHAQLIDGTIEAIEDLRARGLKIGTTTGYSRAVMEVLLPLAAAQGYTPDHTVTPSEVPAGRPAPWMIHANMQALDVYPPSAVVKVGDTVPDIQEGINAGVWTIGVAGTGSDFAMSAADAAALSRHEYRARLDPIADKLVKAGAHVVIRTIRDLPEAVDRIEKLYTEGGYP